MFLCQRLNHELLYENYRISYALDVLDKLLLKFKRIDIGFTKVNNFLKEKGVFKKKFKI